jgi:hypothetical protein
MRLDCCALLLGLVVVSPACVAHEQGPPPVQPGSENWAKPVVARPVLRPPPPRPVSYKPAKPAESILLAVAKPKPPEPPKDWRTRASLALAHMEERDPILYERLMTVQPNRKVGTELFFTQPDVSEPYAAPVLLKRLLDHKDPIPVRLAVVDALPTTGGDWQEGAASWAGLDGSHLVRKKLVEMLRYVPAPACINALRLAFRDEEDDVRIAAARTSGFVRDGIDLYPELIAGTTDDNWDMRVASAQALGQLRVRAAWDRLVRLLSDPHPQVRLRALLSLERIDPVAVRRLPDLTRLAKNHLPGLAGLARRMIAERSAEDLAAMKSTRTPETPPAPGASAAPVKPTTQPATLPAATLAAPDLAVRGPTAR